MKIGKLIVLEGACDGIGKSTQLVLLKDRLSKDGVKVATHHYPTYNTFQGRPVEEYLKGTFGQSRDLSPYFVNTLYAEDRAITWNLELKKKYEDGETLLLDRYTTSSLIYQSAVIEDLEERKKFIDYVCDFEYNKLGIKSPDHIIFLHAPFELVTGIRNARKNNEGIPNDIYERDLEFMHKIYKNAMFLADYLSWDKVRCDNGNQLHTEEGFRSVEEIHNDIYKILQKKSGK